MRYEYKIIVHLDDGTEAEDRITTNIKYDEPKYKVAEEWHRRMAQTQSPYIVLDRFTRSLFVYKNHITSFEIKFINEVK